MYILVSRIESQIERVCAYGGETLLGDDEGRIVDRTTKGVKVNVKGREIGCRYGRIDTSWRIY